MLPDKTTSVLIGVLLVLFLLWVAFEAMVNG